MGFEWFYNTLILCKCLNTSGNFVVPGSYGFMVSVGSLMFLYIELQEKYGVVDIVEGNVLLQSPQSLATYYVIKARSRSE